MRTARDARTALGGKAVEDRQRKGRGLAGARLRDAEQILALHQMGDRLRLDRRRRKVILGFERTPQRFGEAEAVESRKCH